MCNTTTKHVIENIEAVCKGFFQINNSQTKGGAITVQSRKTGKDFTFKIKTETWKGRTLTKVWVETEYLKFRYIGKFNPYNSTIVRWDKLKERYVSIKTPAAAAVAWLLKYAAAKDYKTVDANVRLLHLGQCIRCNRPLTDATSIDLGMGAVCRGKK